MSVLYGHWDPGPYRAHPFIHDLSLVHRCKWRLRTTNKLPNCDYFSFCTYIYLTSRINSWFLCDQCCVQWVTYSKPGTFLTSTGEIEVYYSIICFPRNSNVWGLYTNGQVKMSTKEELQKGARGGFETHEKRYAHMGCISCVVDFRSWKSVWYGGSKPVSNDKVDLYDRELPRGKRAGNIWWMLVVFFFCFFVFLFLLTIGKSEREATMDWIACVIQRGREILGFIAIHARALPHLIRLRLSTRRGQEGGFYIFERYRNERNVRIIVRYEI